MLGSAVSAVRPSIVHPPESPRGWSFWLVDAVQSGVDTVRMVDGITSAAITITALGVVYATLWVLRHEAAVRRFRAESERSIDRP